MAPNQSLSEPLRAEADNHLESAILIGPRTRGGGNIFLMVFYDETNFVNARRMSQVVPMASAGREVLGMSVKAMRISSYRSIC